jgi:hypothetical protein
MPLESASFIADLNTANPAATDGLGQADDHMRLIKAALQNTFPNFTSAALEATQAEIDAAVDDVVAGTIPHAAGTAAAPGFTFIGDTDTGVYGKAANELGFSTAGALAAYIDSAKKLYGLGALDITGAANFQAAVTIGGALGITGALTGAAGTFSGVLTQSSTSHGVLSTGTTAQRPGSPAAGHFRHNSTLGVPEFHEGNTWRQVSAVQAFAGFKNLLVYNNAAAPTTKVDLTADSVYVEDTSGIAYRLNTVSLTIDASVNGANGLDASGLSASKWYSVWVIYNPTTQTTAGLLSLSATAPTMPSGYTAKARAAWFPTNASSAFLRVRQAGRKATYVIASGATGSNTNRPPIVYSGAALGTTGANPVLVAKQVRGDGYAAPSTAVTVHLLATNNRQASGGADVYCAPNTGWGYTATGPTAAEGVIWPLLVNNSATNGSNCWMVLESDNVGLATGGGGAALACLAWEDSIHA